MAEGGAKHDYHLAEASPWPLVGALGVFIAAAGAVFWLNRGYGGFGVLAGIPWISAIGLALVLATMAGWWRDMVSESVAENAHTPVVKLGFRYGMLLFLIAEAMFFAGWFWAWFHFRLFPHDAGLTHWPPNGITAIGPWGLPLFATVILLTSATTMAWAYRAVRRANQRGTVYGLLLTIVLGFAFVAVEVVQCAQAPFSFGFNGAVLQPLTGPAHASLAAGKGSMGAIYGSIFLLTTGFCVLHALAATVFLAVCLGRARRGHFTPERHSGFVAALWAWQFLIGLWLLLFAGFYVF